jgi:hypothetical protein
MDAEDELAFLKAHLAELSPTVLKLLKREIVAETRRREAEATAKAKGSGERPRGQPSGRQTSSAGERNSVSHKAHRATVGKRKAKELNSSDWGGSMEPGTRRLGQCPVSGPRPCLHRRRALPPKTRWVYPPPPQASLLRLAAGNSATLRLARRSRGSDRATGYRSEY